MTAKRVVYIFDSSALIRLRDFSSNHTTYTAAMGHIRAMILAGQAIAPKQVWEELRTWDRAIREWTEEEREQFFVAVELDRLTDVLAVVPQIVTAQRSPQDGPEEADPYLLALALQVQAGDSLEPVVVTDDFKDTPEKASVLSACGALRITGLSISRLLVNELGLFVATGNGRIRPRT